MSIRINLEIGHEASLRTKRTPEGFTHDWEVFVRGCDKADIHNYVEKVVFNLHETFPRPKRIVKEPPYSVKESGYAGFTFPIDIYLKNRDEPKIITFDYDLQLQPSGPSISNVQKENYVFSAVPEDFKHKLLKGGGIIVSLSAQDNAQESRASEEKNQLYNKPNFGTSSDSSKKHKGGSKGPQTQSQMPNEQQRPSPEFVNLFGDTIYKTNQTTIGGDANKGTDGSKWEKMDRGDKDGGGRSNKDKISDKDKSKSKSSPNITKDRDKDKSTKSDKATISEPPERTKKDDKSRSTKDRAREKQQRDRSKDEKASNASNANAKRDKSPTRPKSPSPITKRSVTPKRRTVTPNPSPKRPPSSPAQKQHRDKSEKRSTDGKDKDRLKDDRKKDRKEKRDKEHKENKHKDKEHRSKDVPPKKEKDKDKEIVKEMVLTAPVAVVKTDKKDKINKDKEAVETPPAAIIPEKTRDRNAEQSSSGKAAPSIEQIPDKPPKHKHKKKDKDKKQKSSSSACAKPDRDDKRDKEASSKKEKKDKTNKLSIDQFIAEPKSNNLIRSPKNVEDVPKGRSKSIIDDDSSNTSIEDVTNDSKMDDTKSRKDKQGQKPKKEKRPLNIVSEVAPLNDEENGDGGATKRKKKRKATELTKPNHKTDMNETSHPADLIQIDPSVDIGEPPEKIPREDIKDTKEKEKDKEKDKEAPSSNGKTVNSTKKEIVIKEDITDDAEDYLKILRELQTKIMSLQDNMELQRVVQLIAETGRYEVSDRTFDFDLCLLDRSTVRQLQEFFANLAT